MAEENILLRVGIDQNEIAKSELAIVSAQKEIEKLKEEQIKLTKEYGKNSVEVVKNQTDIKDLSTTIRENQRVLQSNAKMNRSAGGSIAKLRESVKIAQAEYVKLSKAERDNEKVGGVLQKTIKSQNDELKELEKQIGNTSRNVGNYKDDINAALKETGLFGKQIALLEKSKKTLNKVTQINILGLKGFRLALIATGIGAIVALLATLISSFLSTQKGIDKVTSVTRPLIAIFDRLKGLVQELSTNVFGGLGKILSGDIAGGLKDIGGAFSDAVGDIGTAITEGAKAGKKLDELQKNIERTDIELTKRRSELNAEFERSKEIAQDQTKTDAERKKAAEDAIEAQNKLLEEEQKFLDLKIEKKELENKLNDTSRADDKELAELIAERTQQEAHAIRKRVTATNLLRSIEEQAESERNKSIAERERLESEADKKRVDDEKKANDEIIAEQKRVTDQFKESVKEREQATQLEIRETVNELKRQFAEGQITPDEFKKQLAEIEAVAIETRRAAFELQLEETRNNTQIEADTKLAIEEDLQQKLRDLNDQTLDVSVKNAHAELQAGKEKDDALKASAELRSQSEIDAIKNVLSIAITAFGESSAAGKVAASFQVLIDTIVGARRAYNTQLVIGDPSSVIRGAIAAAAVSASGLAQVTKINSKQVPKLADGGGIEVGGPSHAAGGVDVALGGQTVANVEGGEGLFVMKKDAFQSMKSLSNYNQMFGGNSWFNGSKKFLADGGEITRGSNPQIDRRSLQDAQNSIGDAMQQIKVITKVTDINRVSNEMKLVEMQGDLR